MDHGVNYAVLTTGVVWIAFIPFSSAGVPFREGLAFVFPNFDAILKNYAVFYDLFAKERIVTRDYNLQFAKAGGLSVTEFEPLVAVNQSETIRMLVPSQLAIDLDPLFREFFGSLSGDTDREMLIECFVETRESKFADASLEKMVRNVSATISELTVNSDNQLAQEIQATIETGHGETVVLVGNNGAGKSTFIERFFDSILDEAVRNRCSVVRIDLLESTGDASSIGAWLTTQVKSKLEHLVYENGNPTFDELQGLYWNEYQRWMKGQYKPLYDADKAAFKMKFGDFLDTQIDQDPYSYVLRLLADIVKNRKLLPCLIFDNGDHFEAKFQEMVFQYSQAIHKSIPFTFIVMPITDRSLWRLSKAGPFQTYPSKMFYLPVPPTKEVLEKRVLFLKRKLEEGKDQHTYFFSKGIRLNLDNIRGFAACVEEVFLREDFVSRRISWLANNNIRKCLELAQKLITSPFFSVEDLVAAYIAYSATVPLKLDYRKFMQALLHGNYNAFQQEHNLFVMNIFAISPYLPTTPLLNLSVLKVLIDRTGDPGGVGGYMSVEQARQYFISMGISEPAIDYSLSVLLNFRLIEPYDASDESLDSSQRVAITHSGRMHYEMATMEQFFVGDMAFATPLRSTSVVDALRGIKSQKMAATEWRAVQKIFIAYCLEQDELYVRLPKDVIYEGQRQLRNDLKARWIGYNLSDAPASAEEAVSSVVTTKPEPGYSHLPAIVKWYNVDKGYGFAEAGLGEDMFVHRNVLQQAEIQSIEAGDTIVCDVAPGSKGKLQVIAIHSYQKRQVEADTAGVRAQSVDGIVEFYDPVKGYGFIRTATLSDDVYLSAKVLEQSGLKGLKSGTKVRAGIEPSRFGKGFMAASVEMLATS